VLPRPEDELPYLLNLKGCLLGRIKKGADRCTLRQILELNGTSWSKGRMLKKANTGLLTRAAQNREYVFTGAYRATTVREFPMGLLAHQR
jgi:hypothetical protein